MAANLATLDDDIGLGVYLQHQRSDRRSRKPLNTAAPVASGTLTVGSLLTCTTGEWSGGYPHTFAYQWLRNGATIVGAVSASYTAAQAGSHACIVYCTTVGGAIASATSNALAVV